MADKDGLKVAKDYHTDTEFANQGSFHVKGANNLDWGMKKHLSNIFDPVSGNTVKVGDVVNVPGIGDVTILANGDLVAGQETAAENNGVMLLPERVVFTAENVANYPF